MAIRSTLITIFPPIILECIRFFEVKRVEKELIEKVGEKIGV